MLSGRHSHYPGTDIISRTFPTKCLHSAEPVQKKKKVLKVPHTLALDYGYHTYVLKESRYMCNKIRKMIVNFGTK